MKTIISIIVLVSLVILLNANIVQSLACQYTEQEKYETNESRLVDSSSGKILGLPLLVQTDGKGENYRDRLKITNPLNQTIIITIQFYQLVSSNETVRYNNIYDNMTIEKNSFVTVLSGKGFFDYYITSIDINSVTYSITNPPNIVLKDTMIYHNRTICKICNAKNCLNDGEKCTSDYQCGSGICNIALLCGKEKIVSCEKIIPYSMNCMNKSCLIPSKKTEGQAYLCKWECESGRGSNGICQQSIFVLAFWWGLLIISLLAIWKVISFVLKTKKMIALILKKQLKEFKDLSENIEMYNSNIHKMKTEQEEIEKTIKDKHTEMQKIKKNLAELEDGVSKKTDEIEKQKNDLNKKVIELEVKKEKIKEITDQCEQEISKLNEKKLKEIDKVLETYARKEGHPFILDERGYVRYKYDIKGNQPGRLLHLTIWRRKNGPIPEGYVIHHIDENKLNNEIENLQMLTKEEHNRKHKLSFNDELDKH